MKVTLASHVITEVIGDQLFLLDSQDKQVYSIPLGDVMEWDPATRTLIGKPSVTSALQLLCDKGVAGLGTGAISRRGVVTAGGVLVGGGVLALALPQGALASSHSGSSGSTGFRGAWQPSTDWTNNPQYGVDSDGALFLELVSFTFGLREEDVSSIFGLDKDLTLTVLGRSHIILSTDRQPDYDITVAFDFVDGRELDEEKPTEALANLVTSQENIEGTLSDGTTTVDVLFTRQDFAEFFGWGSA